MISDKIWVKLIVLYQKNILLTKTSYNKKEDMYNV